VFSFLQSANLLLVNTEGTAFYFDSLQEVEYRILYKYTTQVNNGAVNTQYQQYRGHSTPPTV